MLQLTGSFRFSLDHLDRLGQKSFEEPWCFGIARSCWDFPWKNNGAFRTYIAVVCVHIPKLLGGFKYSIFSPRSKLTCIFFRWEKNMWTILNRNTSYWPNVLLTLLLIMQCPARCPVIAADSGSCPAEQWKKGPWLFRVFLGGYTTRLCGDLNKKNIKRIPGFLLNNQDSMGSKRVFLWLSCSFFAFWNIHHQWLLSIGFTILVSLVCLFCT